MKRLAVARFYFQGNAFSPEPASLETCMRLQWACGSEVLADSRGGDTELAAVAAFATSHADWQVSVLRCAAAQCAGPLDDALFERIVAEICAALAGSRWDAVYVALHGAAITDARTAPDLELLRAVRAAIGDTPLAASFDYYANINPALAELVDFATGARTSTASDLRETSARALQQLLAIAAGGARPKCAIVSTGMVLPGLNTGATDGPMVALLQAAREAEEQAKADISLFAGFPYADSPQCAAKVMVWAPEGSQAHHNAGHLAAAWRGQKTAYRAALPGPNVALHMALRAPAGLVAITDPADDPDSGGGADSTTLFRALLELSGDIPAVFAFFADAALLEQAQHAGPGGAFRAAIGARTSRDFGARVEALARVLKLTDGRFRNRGPLACGAAQDIGPSALLEVAGVKTIVTSRRVSVDDPAFFELHGIDLAGIRLLCVKGRQRFRRAFSPLCVQIIDCDAPGPAAMDLRALPFQNVRMR